LFTGKGREDIAIQALNLGANYYINKHGTPKTVYGELTHAITNSVKSAKAKGELKNNEELQRAIVANSPIGIATLAVGGNFLSANEAFCRILGYTVNELKKMSFKDITHPDYMEDSIQAVTKLNSGKIPFFSLEKKYIRKNGASIDGKVTVSVLQDQKGNPRIHIVKIEDITEQKQAQEKLKSERDMLDKITESMGAGLALIDKNYNIVWANKYLKKYNVISPEKKCYSTFAHLDSPCPDCGVTKIFKEKKPFDTHEFSFTDIEGKKRWAEIIASPITDKEGNIIAAAEISVDITEQKKAENQLRENEEHLRFKLEKMLSPDVEICEQDLANILDLPKLQGLMDNLYEVTKIASAIIDLNGNILVKTGWREICTKFHRANPQTLKNCLESDVELTRGVKPGEYKLYKCKNNLWDVSTPLILNGKHVANIFSGQFLLEDDKISSEFFAAQAEKYGFNKEEYLDAFKKVQRFNREKIEKTMHFNVKLSELISQLSLSNLKLTKAFAEQKTIEKKIRESERRWAVTLSSIGDGVIATDVLGKVSFMNSVAEQLTGWTLDEAAGKSLGQVFNIVNEQSRLSVESPVAKVLLEGVVVGLANHTVLVRRDGTEVSIDDSGAPIRDDQGNITGVVLVFRDITKRKKTEETLAESETKYRRLLDGMTDTAWVIDDECNIIDVNRSASESLGYTKKELLKMNLTDIDNNLKAEKIKYLVKTMPKDKIQVFETAHTTKNGLKIPVEISSSLVTYKGKQAILSIARNITERKKTEATLYLNKILLEYLLAINKMEETSKKELLDFALEAIIKVTQSKFALISLVNDDQTILTIQAWSKNAMKECKTTQKPTDYYLSQAGIWAEPIRQRKPIFIEDYNAANLKKRGLPEGHVKIKNYLGVPIFEKDVVVAMAAVANKNGFYTENDALTISSVMNDTWRIIQRKNFESEREQNLSKLSMLNEKLNVVGSLTRHDVRNKLMAIKAKTYLLKKKNIENAELIRNLEGVETTVDSAAALLAFSGLYEKIGAEELREINVEECFNQALALRRSVQNVKIINETKGLTVIADKLLSEVFYNLLDNSLRHGQRVTQIRLFTIKDGNKLKLIYEDNGVGVSEENKDKIFVGGFSTGRSSGLGLKLIKRVIEGYGWSIVENGEPNKGAKFTITIPQTTQE
ncbi:MAG: PAS domain S-box protein, partial [Candidatus Bathyarchaeota archaeon]|nr:PAS domain S-box protein [Candidatus Bathyarchaeota archaeon]